MKIFLDANIILDLIDLDRKEHTRSKEKIVKLLQNGDELFTSCDIFTTIYYVASKKINSDKLITLLEKILVFVQIISIDISMINSSIALSKQYHHKDLEDILQYICAKKSGCEMIYTNDKDFFSPDIKLLSNC